MSTRAFVEWECDRCGARERDGLADTRAYVPSTEHQTGYLNGVRDCAAEIRALAQEKR